MNTFNTFLTGVKDEGREEEGKRSKSGALTGQA
jgi:hypothetical protein